MLVGLLTLAIPYSPLAAPLGLVGPSLLIQLTLVAITIAYVIATEIAKLRFYRRSAATLGLRRGGRRYVTGTVPPT